MSAAPEKIKREEDPDDSFKTYFEYNKVLRTWFVAFGVGGPALFLVNEKVAERLATNWYSYIAAYEPDFKGTRRHRFSEWYTHAFWIDIWIDVTTIVCFGVAGWRLFTIFAK